MFMRIFKENIKPTNGYTLQKKIPFAGEKWALLQPFRANPHFTTFSSRGAHAGISAYESPYSKRLHVLHIPRIVSSDRRFSLGNSQQIELPGKSKKHKVQSKRANSGISILSRNSSIQNNRCFIFPHFVPRKEKWKSQLGSSPLSELRKWKYKNVRYIATAD